MRLIYETPPKAIQNDNLKQLLAEIQASCNEFELLSLTGPLQSLDNFAKENRYLDVAVLGQFKAGKSSFLNSFLGQPLLPTGSIPVTSVITRIKYGQEIQAVVTFSTGNSQKIDVAEINSFVTEADNPRNHKNVVMVDIDTPAMAEIKAIRLVDTPGIGSIWKHNSETTTAWFPETGGAFLLVSAERPISAAELDLLQEIHRYSPEIWVVITKTDLFNEDKLREIQDFTTEVIKKALGQDLPVFRYSTLNNTQPFNETINIKALNPLALNRDQAFAKILKHKASSLAESCLSYLDVAHNASLKTESESKQLKNSILDEYLNSTFVRQELLLIIQSYKQRTRESLRIYFESQRASIRGALTEQFDCAAANWKGNLYQLTRQYEDWIKSSLSMELTEILLDEEKSYELITAVRKHLSFYLKSFRERLTFNLERALGVAMKSEQWEMDLRELDKPNISISRSFDMHIDMLWFLFPMFIFRSLFLRYFKKQISLEVDKNLHRLTSALTEKVNKEMDYLMKQALAYMNEELRIIQGLLTGHSQDSSLILERKHKIKSLLDTM